MAEVINLGPGPIEENVGSGLGSLEGDLGGLSPIDFDVSPDNIDLLDDEVLYSVNTNGKVVVTGVYPQNKYEWDKPNIYDVNWVDDTTMPFIVAISDGKTYPKFFTSKFYYNKLKDAFESINPNPYFLEESFRIATLLKINIGNLVQQVGDNELDERTDRVVVYKNVFISKQYSAAADDNGDVVYTLENYFVDYASLVKYIDWCVKKRNPALGDDYNTVLNEQEIGNYIINRVNLRPKPVYDKFGVRVLNKDEDNKVGMVYTARSMPFFNITSVVGLISKLISLQWKSALEDLIKGVTKPEGLDWVNGDTIEFSNYTDDPITLQSSFSTDPINTYTAANQSEWVYLSDIFKPIEEFTIPAKSKVIKKLEFKPSVDPISLQPIVNGKQWILNELKGIVPSNIYSIIESKLPEVPSTISIFGWPTYFEQNNLSFLSNLKPNGINLNNNDTAYRGVITFVIKDNEQDNIPLKIELRKQVGNNFTP